MSWSDERANRRKEVQREDKIRSNGVGIKTYHTLLLMPCISGSLNADYACSEVSCCVLLR